MVHEVEHTLHVSECDAFQVEDQRALLVGRLVSSKDRPEEGATGAEDHFVGLKLLIVTSGDSDVKKLLLVPKVIIFKMLIIFKKMATNTKHAFTHQSPAIDYLMSLNAELMFLSKSFHRKQNFSEFAIVVIFCDYLNLIHIFQSCAFLEFDRPMSSSLLGQSNVLVFLPFQRCTKCSVVSKTHRIGWR